jgi:hypothetical protein
MTTLVLLSLLTLPGVVGRFDVQFAELMDRCPISLATSHILAIGCDFLHIAAADDRIEHNIEQTDAVVS